jgi:hypothetical protein
MRVYRYPETLESRMALVPTVQVSAEYPSEAGWRFGYLAELAHSAAVVRRVILALAPLAGALADSLPQVLPTAQRLARFSVA